jgi:hypothetical protein
MTLVLPHGSARAAVYQGGAALVIGLLLLLVMTMLALTGMSSAALELQMAGNEQFQERAFQAAESGIAQALAAGGFTTNPAAFSARYIDAAAPDPIPIRGQGRPIAGCPAQSGDAAGQCEYFLRFDLANGITPVPGEADDTEAGLAYHFVIDSYGVAERGAQSQLTLGFYVIAPGGSLPEDLLNPPVVQAYWHQRDAN